MNRNIFYWALYDFGNSFILIVYLFYFSQWLVVDSGRPDWWFNATLIGSSFLFILTAPVIGQWLDATRKRLAGLRLTSVITLALYLSISLVAILAPGQSLLAAILFVFGLYMYLTTFVFYTPMINDLSTETNKGFISGLGMSANYLGQVIGVMAVLPFATGFLHTFGAEGRAQTLLPAVILCGIFVLPMLLWYREPLHVERERPLDVEGEYEKLSDTMKRIFSVRNLSFVLLSYFFVSNALLTLTNNFPLFLEKVYEASDAAKSFLTAGILILSALGSLVLGKLADRVGHQRTLFRLLVCWVFLFPILALAPSFQVAIAICLVGGFLFGPVWSISRAMVAELAPKELVASTFSFYIIAERFATLVGPILWSVVIAKTQVFGPESYNYAVLSMCVLVLVALHFISRVSSGR